MSDAIPLPLRPDTQQYRKQAKELLKACRSTDPHALRAWIARWSESWAGLWAETEARLRGVPVTPQLRAEIVREIDRIEKRLTSQGIAQLSDAQLFLARAHGFLSWPKFTKHIQALQNAASPDAAFEAAADAIVSGDIATLRRLLSEDPDLIHRRSGREHRSILLHYISANGIEDFRQTTPANIVAIARQLLDSGADVHAESDAYGGHSTTLGLVATSAHPRRAGLQIPLLELLLERGAVIERTAGEAVDACLANGCPEAAEYLASRGAQLSLEGAAGVGNLDVVRTFFADGASLRSTAAEGHVKQGFLFACAFGRDDVVAFLIDHGVDPGIGAVTDMTGLHWAAHEGHLSTVELLLSRHAPLEATNVYGGTVLGGAVWSALHHRQPDHLKIIETLVAAGARIGEDWFTGREDIDEVLQRGRKRTQPKEV